VEGAAYGPAAEPSSVDTVPDAPAAAFVSRLVRLHLIDAEGDPLGRLQDVVLVPSGERLRVLGLVANVERRNIFVNMARVSSLETDGVQLSGSTVNLRSFHRREGELLAVRDLFNQRIGDEHLTDVAIAPGPDHAFWYVEQVALGRRGPLWRRAPRVVAWTEVAGHFTSTPVMDQVAELRDLHPTDVVAKLQALTPARRQEVVALLADEQVADLLEEMPEEEAVHVIETLDLERAAHILEEMEPDDAVDLLADLPEDERVALLREMRPEESMPLRRLLAYDEDTAGGLMTPEPVILADVTSVAEALATIRVRNIPSELAAQVFVTQPPMSTPTGRFLGVVSFQRLLREEPSTSLVECVGDTTDSVSPDLSLREVAERLASYDLLALPVCDHAGRLVGAVTVDDVLDHVLPDGWRRRAGR